MFVVSSICILCVNTKKQLKQQANFEIGDILTDSDVDNPFGPTYFIKVVDIRKNEKGDDWCKYKCCDMNGEICSGIEHYSPLAKLLKNYRKFEHN